MSDFFSFRIHTLYSDNRLYSTRNLNRNRNTARLNTAAWSLCIPRGTHISDDHSRISATAPSSARRDFVIPHTLFLFLQTNLAFSSSFDSRLLFMSPFVFGLASFSSSLFSFVVYNPLSTLRPAYSFLYFVLPCLFDVAQQQTLYRTPHKHHFVFDSRGCLCTQGKCAW